MNYGEVKQTLTYTCVNCSQEVTEEDPEIKTCVSYGSYGTTTFYVCCPKCKHEDEVEGLW